MPKPSDTRTFVRFVLVGGGTAALYAAILVLGVEGAGAPPTVGAGVAYVLAIAFNYGMHHRWTYGTDRPHRSSGPRYLLLIAVLFLLNVVATAAIPDILGVGYGVVQLILAAVFALVTFVGLGRWVFTRRGASLS